MEGSKIEGGKNDKGVLQLSKRCVICNKEFVALRRDAEVCSSACRQKNWRRKKEANPSNKDPLELLLDWRKEVDAWCGKRGWKAEELIEKFEQLERRLGETIANSSYLTFKKDMTPHEVLEEFGVEAYNKAISVQNKPDTAPQIEKSGESTPKAGDDKDGTGLGSQIIYADPKDSYDGDKIDTFQDEPPKYEKPKPKAAELSPFLKSRQNLKNGIK